MYLFVATVTWNFLQYAIVRTGQCQALLLVTSIRGIENKYHIEW